MYSVFKSNSSTASDRYFNKHTPVLRWNIEPDRRRGGGEKRLSRRDCAALQHELVTVHVCEELDSLPTMYSSVLMFFTVSPCCSFTAED